MHVTILKGEVEIYIHTHITKNNEKFKSCVRIWKDKSKQAFYTFFCCTSIVIHNMVIIKLCIILVPDLLCFTFSFVVILKEYDLKIYFSPMCFILGHSSGSLV